MKWFSDVAMLAGEWLLLMVIPLVFGIIIGWFLWYRNWRRAEAEKKSVEKELISCRDERDSISVGWGEEMQSMKNKLHVCREEIVKIENTKKQALQALEDRIRVLEDEKNQLLMAAEEVTVAVETPAVDELQAPSVEEADEVLPIEEIIEERIVGDIAGVDRAESLKNEPKQMSIIDLSPDKQMSDEDIFKQQLALASDGRVIDYEDDLKLISGVGPKMEKLLKDFGVKTFYQLSNFKDEGIHALNDRIDAFPGRIERDDWIGQAKTLHDKFHE